MLLKSIKLNNIRSYINQKIDFPIGSLLLSGDIGSGKSTVLLAVEFALFGSKQPELPASSLLRHGKQEGSVELNFELDGKNVIIKRSLKREKNGVRQEIGYIISGGVKKELSAIEMKSHIFDMLGYPKDLVSKNKDVIYRYTVYTPQEEMKRILAEDKDIRLNTLRKVFNIDKYKKIRENTIIFIRSIKEKRKEFEGFISDLEEKKSEFYSLINEIKAIDEQIKAIILLLEEASKKVKRKKGDISAFEDKIEQLNILKNDFKVCEAELNNLVREHNKTNQDIINLSMQIGAIEKELHGVENVQEENAKSKIKETEANIKLLQSELNDIRKKLNEGMVNKKRSEEIINKVLKIDKCPLCMQNVQHEHKSFIKERESINIKEAEESIKAYSQKEKKANEKLEFLDKEINDLRKLDSKIELIKLRLQNIEEKRQNKFGLEKAKEEIKKKIGALNIKKEEISKQIGLMKNVEEEYKKAKNELDTALEEERKFYAEKTGLEKEKQSLERISRNIEQEINKKLKAKEKIKSFIEMQNWLESYFINLMDTIEKHIMLQVYRQFNELFKSMFNLLIEDETISVRLDDEFTPVIEQNGYETYVDNLSGGEKTAVALSYRLALNKVTYDLSTSIKTMDILMLDEPTDGFSSEQLDSIRDVLEQLDTKQIIIVSHESKIESFVDNVIKIVKDEHVSRAY